MQNLETKIRMEIFEVSISMSSWYPLVLNYDNLLEDASLYELLNKNNQIFVVR